MSVNSTRYLGIAAVCLMFFGCATHPAARIDSAPAKAIAVEALPEENVNDFSEVLECVGRQVAAFGTQRLIVGNDRIYNESGVKEGLPESGRTLLQSAFSSLVEHSNGKIVWIGWNSMVATEVNQQIAIENYRKDPKQIVLETAEYNIFGSITQYEKDAQKATRDADVKISDNARLGSSQGANLSVLATNLTLHSAKHSNMAVYKGIQSNNIISVKNHESAVNVSLGSVSLGGIGFNVSLNKKEGVSAALMTLMQLGAIELTGKFYKDDFDYKVCLKPDTRSAINKKLGWVKQYAKDSTSAALRVEKPRFSLYAKGDWKGGERVEFDVKTAESGHLYCFYSMSDGRMVRIFPNRYVHDSFVPAGSTIQVPGSRQLTIAADAGVTERFDCIMSRVDIARIVSNNSSLAPNRDFSFEKLNAELNEYLSPHAFYTDSFEITAK